MGLSRQSQESNFGAADTGATLAQAGGGYQGLKYDEFRTADYKTGASDRVLQSILGDVGNLMKVGDQTAKEEAYLQGASKVGQVESEAELEGSLITRDWAVAGYRDTSGRLALASKEAELAKDMLTLREQSPEKMQEYLGKRRAELVPTLEGMSREQRGVAFGKLLLNDRAAIAEHTTEHTKFIVETKATSIRSNYATSLAALVRATAGGSPGQQQAAVDQVTGVLKDIITSPELPVKTRNAMLTEATQHALAENQTNLYDQIRNTPIPDPRNPGKDVPIFNMLSGEDQIKLANQHREAMGRTENLRSVEYDGVVAKYKSVLGNDSAPLPDRGTFVRDLDHGTRNKFLGQGARISLDEAYWNKAAKQGNDAALVNALASGDYNTVFALGKTNKDAVDATIRQGRLSGVDRGGTIQNLAVLGTKGIGEAFTAMGELTKGDVANMLNTDGTVNVQSAQVVHNILENFQRLEGPGKDGSFTSYLKAFDPEAQSVLTDMREAQRFGKGAAAAAQFASERATENRKFTTEQRNAKTAGNAKEDLAYADTLGEVQFFGNLWNKTKQVVGFGADTKLMTERSYWENPDRVAESVEQTRTAVIEEMGVVGRMFPMKSAESRADMAITAVTKRTIRTEGGGNLVLPRGADIQRFFGVPASAGNEDIGKALDALYKPITADGRVSYLAHEGRIRYTERSKDGLVVKDDVVNPKDVNRHLQDMWAGAGVTANEYSGTGVTRKVGDLEVNFNGRNTAAVEDSLVFRFRDNLIKHEGVRDTPYEDLSGKVVNGKKVTTVGVGVSSHNPHYPKVGTDGKVTKAAIEASFIKASDDAAVAGAKVQRALGMQKSNAAFLLFSELAYQSGTSFHSLPAYKDMLMDMQGGDVDKAVAALRKTPAWGMSGGKYTKLSGRQTNYEAMLRKAMET